METDMSKFVVRYWPAWATLSALCFLASCGVKQLIEDPSQIQPLAEDVAEAVDVPAVINDATAGNWVGVAARVAAGLVVLCAGLFGIKKIRAARSTK